MNLRRLCCLCSSRSYLCSKGLRSLSMLLIRRDGSSSTVMTKEVHLDGEVEKQLAVSGKHRQHAGVMKLRPVSVPDRLERAIQVLIEKYPTKDLLENAEKLNRYLMCRHPAIQKNELRRQARIIEDSVRADDDVDIENLSEEEKQQMKSKWKGKTLKQLREKVYHWAPVEYSAYKGFLYMVGRMAHDYAIVLRVLSEIERRQPDFKPRSIFDLGSGVGSVIWASNTIWEKSVLEYYCVDPSTDMNTLARLLLQDGEDNKKMSIPGVYFRQFHPSSKNQFHLTISAFTLFEFPSKEERLAAVTDLWNMTQDFMVLIENGSNAGYLLVQEARSHLVQIGERDPDKVGHLFAPCPHDLPCPKLSWTKKISCNTDVNYKKLRIGTNSLLKETGRFSYIILRKGSRTEGATNWPRLVKQVSKRSNHTPCTVCSSDGTIKQLTITAGKSNKDLYKCSRYCNLGDLLPVTLPDQSAEDLQQPHLCQLAVEQSDHVNYSEHLDDSDETDIDNEMEDPLSPSPN